MTVFNTFWKVIKKYKGMIILYTVLLIVFGGINMSSSEKQMNFVDTKPDVFIVNYDSSKLSKSFVHYIEEHSNIVSLENDEDTINDAVFYRDVNYVIYIPEGYSSDVMHGEKVELSVKSTGDYQASLAEMMLTRYLKLQSIYLNIAKNEDELISLIEDNLDTNVSVSIVSSLDVSKTSNASLYFSFASYSIMAIIIFIICIVLSSFKHLSIQKRTMVSSMSYQKHSRMLLVSSFVYAFIVWGLFVILGMILLGDIMFTKRGLVYMLNSFLFTFCSLTIALFISSLVRGKNAVSGIVNVIALGSAFLCGAFVPMEWLPDSVVMIAKVLPSYWYIRSNDLLKTMEEINFSTLEPIFVGCIVLFSFCVLFIVLNQLVLKYQQKRGV